MGLYLPHLRPGRRRRHAVRSFLWWTDVRRESWPHGRCRRLRLSCWNDWFLQLRNLLHLVTLFSVEPAMLSNCINSLCCIACSRVFRASAEGTKVPRHNGWRSAPKGHGSDQTMVKYQAVSIEVAQVLHDSIKFDTTSVQRFPRIGWRKQRNLGQHYISG